MTRKDYEKTAAILAAERAISDTPSARIAVSAITFSIADMFAQDNPRFDRQTFYTAAGIPTE